MYEKNNKTNLHDLHSEAIINFDRIQTALKDERQQCLNDRRFYSIAGAQWEGDVQRFFEDKPKIEVNKIHLSIIRIINEYRNNRITVNFTSKDGVENDKLADVCDGLYRADENDSNANEAYDNAFEEAVGGGIGAWRLRTKYEDEYDDEDERQRICIEPIYDADSSVFFDLDSKKQDKSDSNYCFVISSISTDLFKETYNCDPSSVSKEIESSEFDWTSPDITYIAEYYKIEIVPKTISVFESLTGDEVRYSNEDFENDETLDSRLDAEGYIEIRQKKVRQRKVHKYLLSGNKILEDCGYIAGKNIPIVMNYGKRWFIDNIERVMGHVRLAKDPQILKNIQLSKLAEISALSPVEKPIFTPEQIAGHENVWREDNTKNYPYMLINPITNQNGEEVAAPPVGYTKPPVIPPALAALVQITDQDIKEVLGSQDQADKMVSNISAKAISLIQDSLSMQTYIYMSNMAKAMQRSGEIWLSMAKDVYIEEDRTFKVINDEGKASNVSISVPFEDPDGGIRYDNDITKAKFAVNVGVEPATSSKRQATIRSLIESMSASTDAETNQVISSLIMLNLEGEGVEDIRPYFRKKLIGMGALKPNEEERREIAEAARGAQPTAEEQYLQAEAAKAEANARKAQADTFKSVAQTEETKAKTAEILAGIDRDDREQVLKVVNEIDKAIDTPVVTVPPQ